ncbi:hypothetical protein IE81DRAFT_352740 [Ceraceosorus guamensis]|uniref:Uncharacterized protein n=1 Tax=Ceraceosorus guamensis TaxID=1522189 RepID=A0A316W4V8_9BASI|nr:hypothetical protein IE81DRAFT_352740 [Ceraceosorus guamensis]PWN44158.1 hypothetical protein IE81DRAFT_352740 [Ceraceosorus guamensis]
MVLINQPLLIAGSVALATLTGVVEAAPAGSAPQARAPQASPFASRNARMERVVLRSTSPPLPEKVKSRDSQVEKRQATKPRLFIRANGRVEKRASAGSKRSPGHEHTHIHEHIHEHGHGHHHGHRHDRDADEKAHHSKHWAIHHGLARREAEDDLFARNGPLLQVGGYQHGQMHEHDGDLIRVLIGRDGEVALPSSSANGLQARHSEHYYDHHGYDHDHGHYHGHSHDHEHIHEHVHEHKRRDHDHDHDHEHFHGHEHSHGHSHVHEHIHEHKRSASNDKAKRPTKAGFSPDRDLLSVKGTLKPLGKVNLQARSPSSRTNRPFRYHPRALEEDVAERGLVGDLVKPLLAPLNAIPGFVTISDLLFGNDGVLKKLGGLVLHAEPAAANGAQRMVQDGKANSLYNYSLMASKNERTQVWLMAADVNSTASTPAANATVSARDAPGSQPATKPSGFENDTTVVRVALPIVDDQGEPVLYCATFAKKPPSSLELTPCGEDPSEKNPAASQSDSSQRFSYTASTGALTPIYAATPNNFTESMSTSAAPLSTSSSSTQSASIVSSSISVASSSAAPAPTASAAKRSPSSFFRILAAERDNDEAPIATSTANASAPATPAASAPDSSSVPPAMPTSKTAPTNGTKPSNGPAKVSLTFVPAGAEAKKLAAKPNNKSPVAQDGSADVTDADDADDLPEGVTDAQQDDLPAASTPTDTDADSVADAATGNDRAASMGESPNSDIDNDVEGNADAVDSATAQSDPASVVDGEDATSSEAASAVGDDVAASTSDATQRLVLATPSDDDDTPSSSSSAKGTKNTCPCFAERRRESMLR